MKRALLPVLVSGVLFGCNSETTEPTPTPVPSPADSAPVATNVLVSGDPMLGNQLTLTYDYFDAEGHAEGDSQIQWFVSVGGNVQQIGDGSPTLDLTGSNGQVGDVYASVKVVAAEGTDKDAASVVYSQSLKTYPAGVAPTLNNLAIASPAPLADGVTLTAFYDYFDADGDAEHEGGAVISWVNRDDGQVLATGKTFRLPVGFNTMDIEVEAVARSVDHEQGAHGKTESDPIAAPDLSSIVPSEPYVLQIDTPNTGWGDGVFLVKNIRNQLLLVKSNYGRSASNDQLRLSSLDVYKLTDNADQYVYEDGFLRSVNSTLDHITFSLGVNGFVAAGDPTLPLDDYHQVKIGAVPFNGAGGGAIERFTKPADGKFWMQGLSLYDDGSAVLDQDVLFNSDNSPVNWGTAGSLLVEYNKTEQLNEFDATSGGAADWYNSPVVLELGVNDATVVRGTTESGDHTDTRTGLLSALVAGGSNSDAVAMVAAMDEGYGFNEGISGNSSIQSTVALNSIYLLQDGSVWSGDSELMNYFNSRINVKWPMFFAESTDVLSVGLGGKSPVLLTQEGVNGSYIYSEDSFSGDPTDVSRYRLPFELDEVEFTMTCTNTNSLYPPLAQGEHHTGGDVNLQLPNTAAGQVAVDPSKGGSGALIARNPVNKQMWYIDTDYASEGVTLSYGESGVLEVRSGTHFEACDAKHSIEPTIVIRNTISDEVSVVHTKAISHSYGADPRLSGSELNIKVKAGAEAVTGSKASASLVKALQDEGFMSSQVEDLDAWVRQDDLDSYVRVADLSSGKMIFQDAAGATLGGTHLITGISQLMQDAGTNMTSKNQEGFVVSDSGIVFTSFADTLRIGGVTDVSEFEEKLQELYFAINSNDGNVNSVEKITFDYPSSMYPLPEPATP